MLGVPLFMTPQLQPAEISVATAKVIAPSHSNVSFRPLSTKEFIAWGIAAAIAFHVAYELCPPLILVFLVCVYQLAHVATRPHAMYSGWVLGLLIYGPQ